ncbi:hypothetical protein P3S67_010175 [Capsicum chacoense]
MKKAMLFPDFVENSLKEVSALKRSFLHDILKPEALKQYIVVMDAMAREHLDENWEMLSMPIDMPRTAYNQAIKGGKICEGCVGFEIKRVSCESLMDVEKMKYSWNAARESLRLTPPAQGSFKETITDFTYAVHLTRQNPKYFSDPEKFDPSRFEGSGPVPFTFVPFGGGPRMCPGKEYA